jgi:hypothetical protein
VRARALVVVVLVACSRDEPRTSVAASATSVTPVTSAAPTVSVAPAAKRCLPVVAADCGCVYTCGAGTETSPGKWNVVHPNWATHGLGAKISPWCVSGDCTDAFHAEIVCSIICPPKPADHTCHFEGERCVSAQKP